MDEHTHSEGPRLTRRRSLATLGGLAASVAGGAAWKLGSAENADGAGPAAVAAGLVTCVLTPEQTEGRTSSRGTRSAATSGRAGPASS